MSASLLLQIAVKVSILLAMVWLTTRAMRRASASVRHFVWTIAILAVLCVPLVVVVGPVWQLKILPARTAIAEPQPAMERDALRPHSEIPERGGLARVPSAALELSAVEPSLDSAVPESATAIAAEQPVVSEVEQRQAWWARVINWQPLLVGLWAAGVTFVLLRLGIGIAWVCWTARRAQPVTDPAWLSLLEEVSKTLSLQGRVSLRRSDRTSVPVACGIWRPTLLMPLDSDEWSEDRRRVVLLHELSHVKRRDCRLQAVAQVAYAWHWFNPLVHVAVARLRVEQERACDDLVLAAGTTGPAYADHLFEIARAFRSDALPRWAMLTMAAPSQLEARVRAILDADQRRQVPSRRLRALVAGAVAVAAVTLGAFHPAAISSDAALTTWQSSGETSVVADDGKVSHSDVKFDAPIASSGIDVFPPATEALPDVPVLAAQGPRGPINPWLDVNVDPQIDLVPPFDINIDIDPVPDPNPDFDFHFDFNFDSLPPMGLFGAAGAQAPADKVPDETRRRVADALSSAINDENPRVREQAIQGLAAMRDPRAVPALVKALQSRDVRLRRIAVSSLGQFDTPEAVQGLMGALKDESPDVRRVAIAALSRRRDDKSADAIVSAMKDENPDVRRQAVAALGRSGQSATVVAALVQALKDPDADVRQRAARSLAGVRSAEAVPALIGALKDANTEVRQMAAIALGSIADPQAIDALTVALKDMDPEVREHAARALSRIARGQRRGAGRFPVANFEFKEWQQEIEKIQKVEMEKVHKQMAKAHQGMEKAYQNLEVTTNMNSWSHGPLDPREMVDEAMRQADKAFKQSEDSWRQLEANEWVEPKLAR